MRPILRTLLPAALLICASTTQGYPPSPGQDSGAAPGDGTPSRTEGTVLLRPDGTWIAVDLGEAAEALAAGEFERAYELIGKRIVADKLARAEELLASGDAPAALNALDDALTIAPRDPRLTRLRGDGLLLLGEDGIASGQQSVFTLSSFEDALAAYRRSDRAPETRLGMARAAYLLNRSEEAAGFAREASALLDRRPGAVRGPNGMSPERVIADALYLAYADQAQLMIDARPEADPAREQALFVETSAAIDDLIAAAPAAASTWNRGIDLMLFRAAARDDEAAREQAATLVELGLERIPTDVGLVDRLVPLTRAAGDYERSIAALEAQLERTDWGSLVQALGVEVFELGMRDFPGEGAPEAKFETALERFRRAESLLERLPYANRGGDSASPWRRTGDGDAARSWRIVCRLARGWTHFWQGDLERATQAFSATEALAANGLEVYLPDRLTSARAGLERVVDRYYRDRNDLVNAALVSDFLHARYPNDSDLANNAGFLNRDAATSLENLGRAFCRAARGETEAAEEERLLRGLGEPLELEQEARRALFAEQASEHLARARTLMRRSRNAYREAARLAPEDIRVLNDEALISIYYLHDELDQARERLLGAVTLGETQLADPDLDDQDRYDLENAWGDAHENLGVLYLEHLDDPESAVAFLERALEIGPDPRPIVSGAWLPRAAAARTGADLEPSAVTRWGRPCR